MDTELMDTGTHPDMMRNNSPSNIEPEKPIDKEPAHFTPISPETGESSKVKDNEQMLQHAIRITAEDQKEAESILKDMKEHDAKQVAASLNEIAKTYYDGDIIKAEQALKEKIAEENAANRMQLEKQIEHIESSPNISQQPPKKSGGIIGAIKSILKAIFRRK
jgi:hypothetical protein